MCTLLLITVKITTFAWSCRFFFKFFYFFKFEILEKIFFFYILFEFYAKTFIVFVYLKENLFLYSYMIFMKPIRALYFELYATNKKFLIYTSLAKKKSFLRKNSSNKFIFRLEVVRKVILLSRKETITFLKSIPLSVDLYLFLFPVRVFVWSSLY